MMRAIIARSAWWRWPRSTRHLGRSLLLLYTVTATAIGAAFSAALISAWIDSAHVVEAVGQAERARASVTRLDAAYNDSAARLLEFLIDGDTQSLALYRNAVATRQSTLDGLASATTDADTRNQVATLRAQFTALDASAERAIAARPTGAQPALERWRAEGVADDASARTALADLATAQDAELDRTMQSANTDHRTIAIPIVLFAAGAALLGLWVIHRIILSITRPLDTLAQAAAEIGAGRLETRVAPGLSTEFDMLGGVMNTMAASLAASQRALQDALSATERRNHELRLLSEVGDALNRSFDLDVLLERSLDLVLTAFTAEAGGVILYDDDGETQHWRDRAGDAGQSAVARWAAARAAHPLSLLDIPAPRVYDLGGDQGRIAVAPLRTAVRTQGMLVIFLASGWQPDERDLDLLEQVGGQIARAAENARLYVAEQDRSAEAGMLAQMAQLTVGTLDLDRLARLIARYAVHVLGVDRCLVGFYDLGGRGTLRQIHQYGFPTQQEALGEGEREELQQVVQRYMLASQTLVVSDAHTDDRPEVRALAARLGARSLISVPLVARDRRVGLIYLDTREPQHHSFSPQDRRILAAIADQAAAALDGARLYEAERRRGEQLRVLNAAGRQIAATPDLAELFTQVTATVREAFGYDAVRVGLIEGPELVFAATDAPDRVPLDKASLAAWVVQHGQARSTATPLPDGDGVRAALAVPLRTKERIVGALLAESTRATAFDDDDERTLASLGDRLGIAIENHRLHERALALAVVDERNRLARELHDSVTQSLFSMHLTIEATRTLLGRGDVAGAGQQLANLSERARETLAEMRALIHSLRPAEMEEQGLVAALTRWTERVRRENLLPVELRVEGTPALSEDEEQELFRIAQEALNNTVKHAAATHVTVQLTTGPAAVTLLVEDDGKGFDSGVPLRGNAFGTRGMRERAAILGGTFSIDSHPGGGTRVLVTVPRTRAMPAILPTTIALTGGEQ